jgi:peptidyl-tRNA hydrolase, PTH1 family
VSSAAGDLLVVGLGNPGDRYDGTRHNVGAAAVELLASRHGARLKHDGKVNARVGDIRIGGRRVVLAVPSTWMNESGLAVGPLVRRVRPDALDSLVVLHDELDLEPGRVKVKVGGGLAGHNGLRSIDAHLHDRGFARVRLGVGKPPGGPERGADWVLSKVRGAAREELEVLVAEAADAVELIAAAGVDAAMQQVNART